MIANIEEGKTYSEVYAKDEAGNTVLVSRVEAKEIELDSMPQIDISKLTDEQILQLKERINAL